MNHIYLLLGLVACTAMADEPQKILNQLRAEIRNQDQPSATETAGPERLSGAFEEAVLNQLLSGEGNVPEEKVPETIRALTRLQVLTRSAKVEELCGELIGALRARTGSICQYLRESYEPTVRNALIKGLEATSSEQVDSWIKQLTHLRELARELTYRADIRKLADHRDLISVEMLLSRYRDCLLAPPDSHGPAPWGHRKLFENDAQTFSPELAL
jgi:hypothetical protein